MAASGGPPSVLTDSGNPVDVWYDSSDAGAVDELYFWVLWYIHQSLQAGILHWVVAPKSPYQCMLPGAIGKFSWL